MDGFRQEVGRYQDALQALSPAELRTLEGGLRELSQPQRDHARQVLRAARVASQVPPNVHQTLEYLLDRWRSHGLALKLAFMARIDSLADERQRWPDDVRTACPVLSRAVTADSTLPPADGGPADQAPIRSRDASPLDAGR